MHDKYYQEIIFIMQIYTGERERERRREAVTYYLQSQSNKNVAVALNYKIGKHSYGDILKTHRPII
jgi:hypothetical protein